jgi:signal transduction histidine kinase/ActR/RegA family two-component response regulator
MAYEIEERKNTAYTPEPYTDALNKSLEIFVSHNETAIDDVISNGLWPVANAASLDRIIVFRVWSVENDVAGEIYRWDKAEGGSAPIDESLKTLPITPALKHWSSMISDGSFITLKRSEFNEGEADFLSPRGVKSILIAPVFTEHKFWGVVTFHDNTNERDFDDDCTAMLCSAARLCANALIRDEKTKNAEQAAKALNHREIMLHTLNKTAIIFLSQYKHTFEDMMSEGLKLIADVMDLDRISVWRNFKKPQPSACKTVVHTSQIYRWDRKLGGTTAPVAGLENFSLDELTPWWINTLKSGESVNSPAKLLPEADLLKSFGCVSLFITPVLIDNNFWGIVFFEDLRIERFFDDDSADIMCSAAHLCVNAVIRAEMEREIAVKNQELQNALEKATAASQAKSEFLSNVSHEIRTPLNAITGMTSIGMNADELDRKDYALKIIEDASTHLLGVINDVLDMSKIEAKMMELSANEFYFEKMLKKTISVLNFRIDEKKQKFKVNIDSNIPEILIGDDQRLSQVITNLLGNAIKFTDDEGSITLCARLIKEENDICTLQIAVSDTGIGISAEQQIKLFNSFQQAESGTTRKFGGTGLGLAISKNIVEMMGGSIWVQSEIQRGSTFTFNVQVKRGNEKEYCLSEKNNIKIDEKKPAAKNTFAGRRILLAEDVEINREIVVLLLEQTLIKIDCAENGAEAVRMFKSAPDKYDLIFMDLQMPEMDGYEATRSIRALDVDNAKIIPIIAMTANVFREDVEKCLRAGMNDHVGKPLDIDEVMDKLRSYIK